ncbi:MAG: DUF167 domain-containing protein [bacterium]
MYIKVFVTPNAKKEKVEENPSTKLGAGDPTLLIFVKEPAMGNRANTRVREIIAERFKKSVGKVRILTGHHSRSKILSVN